MRTSSLSALARPLLVLLWLSGCAGVVDSAQEIDYADADEGTPTSDTTPPSVAITSPAFDATFAAAQTVAIDVTASDDVGVAKVELFEGSTLKGTDTSSPFGFSWSVTSAENGSHTFTAKATDAAGNSASSAPVTVVVSITSTGTGIPTQPSLKVAFIGDSGAGSNFKNVLNLVKSEGADFVMHQGDFDYQNNPSAFFSAIDSVMGPGYPYYFASVGNHDASQWPNYAVELKKRWTASGAALDDPNLGDEMYTLQYKGLSMVMVGQNGSNTTFANFLKTKLAADNHVWKICSWHKNQNAMQVGGKSNEMGWDVYENCRLAGGIPATGHEHSYSRTKTLTSITNQTVDSTCNDPKTVCVGAGRTFVFVSGLGGVGIRNQDRCLPFTYPYGCKQEWAMIYSSDQGAKYGALFIDFNVDANPKKARAYFKNISGQVVDSFTILKD
ncbi:MAG: metallophosphoesterase [Myxococcales bacterium]|nr:metallophosphoesterase [Myxococcales bacterium]